MLVAIKLLNHTKTIAVLGNLKINLTKYKNKSYLNSFDFRQVTILGLLEY